MSAKELGIAVQDDPEPERNLFIRSDQYSFVKQGVPALFLSEGWEPGSPEGKTVIEWLSSRYHAPSDDLTQPVNLEAADRFNQLMSRLAIRIANAERAPQWKENSFFRAFAPKRNIH
jgi:Zn-dependent M28 family amino/carboxypeptidase